MRSGELKPGTPLPAIRQLATRPLQLNPNTVAKAYRLLERDAVIETRGRHGLLRASTGQETFQVDLGSPGKFGACGLRLPRCATPAWTDSEIRNAFTSVMKVQP